MDEASLLYTWQTAATDMENAIKEMESNGVQSYILDLRNNPVILSIKSLRALVPFKRSFASFLTFIVLDILSICCTGWFGESWT